MAIEPQSLGGETVQARRLLGRVSVGADVASQVVRDQHHNVGLLMRSGGVDHSFSQANVRLMYCGSAAVER